jgi:hypothetical protein
MIVYLELFGFFLIFLDRHTPYKTQRQYRPVQFVDSLGVQKCVCVCVCVCVVVVVVVGVGGMDNTITVSKIGSFRHTPAF